MEFPGVADRPSVRRAAPEWNQIAARSAARVYDAPVVMGDRITIAATRVGPRGRRRKPVAVVHADAQGVRVRPVVDFARLGAIAAAAAFVAWRVTRR